jgi:hypothetical protein
MHSTAIDRRTFLALAGTMMLTPGLATAGPATEGPLFLGARKQQGRFEAAVIDARGNDHLVLPLEARGHSFALDPATRRAVAFARAPGRFAIAFDLDGAAEPVAIAATADRHFFGHGIYAASGRLLLATENDYDGERGVTGIYDASDAYRRIGELPTGGVGPHEVLLAPDGRTAIIANGGILTHPDYDRIKLNLATMAPNLTYLDIDSGEIVEQAQLPSELHQLSIRHMALDRRGDVWFGCQFEGDPLMAPPLVGRHRRGSAIELFRASAELHRTMSNYIGSVAIDASGDLLATSAPHGGVVVFWDTATGACMGSFDIADGCGVAPLAPGSIIASSGRGELHAAGPGDDRLIVSSTAAWDNHLRRI